MNKSGVLKSAIFISMELFIIYSVFVFITDTHKKVKDSERAVLRSLNSPNVAIIVADDFKLFEKLNKNLPNADVRYIPVEYDIGIILLEKDAEESE